VQSDRWRELALGAFMAGEKLGRVLRGLYEDIDFGS
jgi:hypothetical protein